MPSERQQYYNDGVYVYELMPYVKLLKVHVTDYTL